MLRFMIRSIEGCGILGIPNLVIHTGYTQQLKYPQDREEYFRCNRKYVEKLLPAAEKHNVTICVENSTVKNMCGAYFFMTPEELNSFVEFVNHPLVGVCWDTGHAVLEGKSDQYDDILALGKNLKAVHIHDNRNDQDFHQPPFSGVLQLDRLLQGLLDIYFAGPFTFESCFFLGACYGDHFRHASPTDAPLAQLPLELRRESIALLYKIGKHILNTYNCFEE
jgi:sugar phosphate isomerase/epimerase